MTMKNERHLRSSGVRGELLLLKWREEGRVEIICGTVGTKVPEFIPGGLYFFHEMDIKDIFSKDRGGRVLLEKRRIFNIDVSREEKRR